MVVTQAGEDETMGISAGEVKELRDRTGAGMMECKKALEETGGDMEAAIDLLRSKGAAKAAKRAGREATEGTLASHVEDGVGALVELNCETDFVARTDDFRALARQLAEHVAKHATELDGAAGGEAVLDQPLMSDGPSVGDVVTEVAAKTGERIVVHRVARFQTEGGQVGSYIHMTGKIGVLVELGGAADEELARDVAMHVAAARPLAVSGAEIPRTWWSGSGRCTWSRSGRKGSRRQIQEKIVEGKLQKFYKEQALIDQPFVKDPDRTIGQLVGEVGVRRFVRFELGD
jgi:elongation factor Ts